MNAPSLTGFRFDGRHAVAVPVLVRFEGTVLVVETLDRRVLERETLARIAISEGFDHAPRLLYLANGVTLELRDPERALDEALARTGIAVSWVVRLRAYSTAVAVALALVVGLSAVAYTTGLPAAARWTAFALSPELEARMGREFLTVLDAHYLRPSYLDPARRARIAAQFAQAAKTVAPGTKYQLEFRSTATPQINAFAFAGGTIVLLDGAVKYADSIDAEDSLIGVLDHELGHVVRKHSVRRVLESMGVGTLGGLLWGDFSSTAASAPVVLANLGYSRQFESEADDFAAAALRRQKLPLSALYRFWKCLPQSHRRRAAKSVPDFLLTHPSTEERLQRLQELDGKEGGAQQSCPPEASGGSGGVTAR